MVQLSRVVRFIKKGDKGDADVIYTLKPNIDVLNFHSVGNGALFTPASFTLRCGYVKTEGNSRTVYDYSANNMAGPYYLLWRAIKADGNPEATFGGVQVYGWDWCNSNNHGYKDGNGNLVIPGTTSHIAIDFALSTQQASASNDSTDLVALVRVRILKVSDGNTGPRGYNGCHLRGPQDWNSLPVGYDFYQGYSAGGESYLDFVLYNGTIYMCVSSHTKTANNYPGSNDDDNDGLWQTSVALGLVCANVFFGDHGFFGDAIISGGWLYSANGSILGVQYAKDALFSGVKAYTLFNPENPFGDNTDEWSMSLSNVQKAANDNYDLSIENMPFDAGVVMAFDLHIQVIAISSNDQLKDAELRLYRLQDMSYQSYIINSSSDNLYLDIPFYLASSGNYKLMLIDTKGCTEFSYTILVRRVNFIPNFCLNLKSGSVLQQTGIFSGHIRRGITLLTPSNISDYERKDLYIGSTQVHFVLDFDKCGDIIDVSSAFTSNNKPQFSLPMLNAGLKSKYNAAQRRMIRSYVGSTLTIYNHGPNLSVTLYNSGNGTESTTIYTGHVAVLRCVLTQRSQKESIEWVEDVYTTLV